MIQTTFTRQKRELAKAVALLDKLRAMEKRLVTFDAKNKRLAEVRETYVDFAPEEIAGQVLDIVVETVTQHGARQQANARNTGKFAWQGIEANLTVPQLRALQQAYTLISELTNKLPRRNPRFISNTTMDGRPAFEHPAQQHFTRKTRTVPYEEKASTVIRTYQEPYEELDKVTQVVEIDYGLDHRRLETLHTMVVDLGTAIQVAIDEANTKGTQPDPLLNDVIAQIRGKLRAMLPGTEQK